jgi:hypothetical protein
VIRFIRSARRARAGLMVLFVAASSAALATWLDAPPSDAPAPSVRIVDIRPLRSTNAELRDLVSHTFAVRVRIDEWTLLPSKPDATARDNRRGEGHWRLYLDGRPLGNSSGDALVSYVYLSPGQHWIAAELSQADSTSLDPPVWSEPLILHVPRVISCWQSVMRDSATSRGSKQACRHPQQQLTVQATATRQPIVTAADLWWVPPGVRLLDQLLGNGHSYKSMAWP